MKQVDIVIAGAGPAGLMAAVLLSRSGHEVAVIDHAEEGRPDRWGFRRENLNFDNFPPLVPGLGEGEPVAAILSDIGLPVDLMRRKATDFWTPDVPLQVILPDARMDLPSDPAALAREVGRLFPGEAKGFGSFVHDSEELRTEIYQTLMRYPQLACDGWWRFAPERWLFKQLPGLSRAAGTTYGDYLRQYVRNPRLTAVLFALSRHLTGRGADGPLFFGLASLALLQHRLWYIAGGTDALRQTLISFLAKQAPKALVRQPVIGVETGRDGATTVNTPGESWKARTALLIDQPAGEACRLLGLATTLPAAASRILQYRAIDAAARPAGMAPVLLALPGDDASATVEPVELYASPAEDKQRGGTGGVRPLTIAWSMAPSQVAMAGPQLSGLWRRLLPFSPERESMVQDIIAPHHPSPPKGSAYPARWEKMALVGKERLGKGEVFLIGRDAFPGGNILFQALSVMRVIGELGAKNASRG
jgi:hypothetical protein